MTAFRYRMIVCGYSSLAVLAVIAVVGCNKSPSMVHVSGKVSYTDGSLLKGGVRVVRFEPTQEMAAEKRRVASGAIDNDGRFELFTRKPGDGIQPGTYNVTFTNWKGEHDPASLIDEKYTAAATTPFKNVQVDRDKADFDFHLEPLAAKSGSL